MDEIRTERLRLVALNGDQLRSYIENPAKLERELGLEVSRDIVTDRLRSAIEMKSSKMAGADPSQHGWYTYWLIVVEDQRFGAGLAGFKGAPDEMGEVEIGYGIDGAFRSKGYMTEAARALIDWAFRDERCRAVTARDTKKENVASQRVLEKLGMRIYSETEDALDWRLDRPKGGTQR